MDCGFRVTNDIGINLKEDQEKGLRSLIGDKITAVKLLPLVKALGI